MRRLIEIVLLFLGCCLTIEAQPLRTTIIPILSPVLYAYPQGDSIYVVTTEGWLFPVSIKRGKNQTVYEKEDSLFIGLEDIRWAGWDGGALFLGNNRGLFRYTPARKLKKVDGNRVLFITSFKNKWVGVLTRQHLKIYSRGHLVSSLPVPRSIYYVQFLNDSVLVLHGARKVFLWNQKGDLLTQFPLDNLHPLEEWKDFIEFYPFLFPRFATTLGDSFFVATGYGTSSDSLFSQLLIYNSRSMKLEGTLHLEGQLQRIWAVPPHHLLIHAVNNFEEGNQYIWNLRNNQRTKLKIFHVMDFFPLSARYAIISTLLEGYEIFRLDYPQIRYKYELTARFRFAIPQFRQDLNGDGIPDWVMIGASGWKNFKMRVYYIVFLENHIRKELRRSLALIQEARRKNNLLTCEKALFAVERALANSHFLLPESTSTFLELRESIYRKVEQKRWIKNTTARIGHFLPFLIALIIIFSLYVRLRRKMDQNRSIPSAETLHFLQGEALFHKLITTLNNLFQAFENNDPEQIQAATREIETFRKYLRQKKVRYEFLEAPRPWRKLYRQLLSQLFCLSHFARNYPWLNKIPLLNSLVLKHMASCKEKLLRLKSLFKNMIEHAKSDVVSGALLPAIEEIQRRYQNFNIIFRTRIQVEFPYRYFPDEILKFQQAFYSILENSVESFLESKQKTKQQNIIEITATSSFEELNILIQDNGQGIPPEVLEKIFLPGFSFGKSGNERGYGLTGVKEFINDYGELKVDSTPGEGTRFHIRLLFGQIPEAAKV